MILSDRKSCLDENNSTKWLDGDRKLGPNNWEYENEYFANNNKQKKSIYDLADRKSFMSTMHTDDISLGGWKMGFLRTLFFSELFS